MKTAKVVIGANFGDEGKGLITDFYAAPHGENALVVRYNGGAQAGHTVVTPDGKRHVYSHFGSGSFAGAHTFLSHFFVCNPILFLKEYNLLRGKTAVPPVHVDGRAPVTTPYDMMINQIAEEARGDGRHGSCGMGFGESIERNANSGFAVVYADLSDKAALKKKLTHTRDNWVPQRLKALGITTLPDKWKERLSSSAVPENFMTDIAHFLQATQLAGQGFLAATKKHIVFEGAQGLLLDQERGWFPHVTRSHTGMKNVLVLAGEAGLNALDVTYITRAYATRHGAGPLPHELPHLPYPRIRDETNVANDWQGTLRFGWLDADLLAVSIAKDLADNKSGIRLRPGLAVTCLDQLEPKATVVKGGGQTATDGEALAALLKKAVNAEFLITSRGPTRRDVSAA
ncbi:MAG: adenylosuccinate synthase [Alphaproteobacteria bacterium]|nr:MAG: adenylosuccinate synthase [Alphaproteobacteria bacterium]